MFRWLISRAHWNAADAREHLRQGNVPRRMRVHGHLSLVDASWLTYLPNSLEAGTVDVSGCMNLRGLPERLRCEELVLRRTNVECLARGLDVSRRIIATNCRKLQRVAPLRIPELRLRACTALERLPEGLHVRHLNLSGCERVTELPANIAACVENLDVSGCFNLERLPEGFAYLETLNVRGCAKLTSLPVGINIRTSIEVADSGLRSRPWTLRSTRLLWRGALVSDRVAFEPESITSDEILSEQNVERRRVLLERVGMEWFVANTQARVVDSDQDAGGERRLLKISFQNGQDVVCIEVHCPSTGHQYILQVPPQTRNCAEAAAWVAGYRNPDHYRPVLET
jgi:Domain of unknown function (DUF6745)